MWPDRQRLVAPAASLLLAAALYLPGSAQAADPAAAVLLPLLSGEFALQEGRHRAAADLYLEAARLSNDPALAERATRIALLANAADLAAAGLARWKQLAPDAAGLAELQAMVAVRQGQQDVALDALRALLGEPDGWQQVLRVLAGEPAGLSVATLLGRLVDAPQFPDAADALIGFGELALRLELDGVSATLSERAIEQHPDVARVWLWRARVEQRRDDPAAARQAIETALALPASDGAIRLAAAALLDALGDPLAAAAALADGAQDDTVLLARAAYLSRADAKAPLAALYDEIGAAAPSPLPDERRYLLGQLAELLERHDEALAWYRGLGDGLLRDQAQLRVAILLDKAGQAEQAEQVLHALQRSDSEHGEVLVDAYLLEAELRRMRGDEPGASAALDRGLAVFEEDPELLYARALGAERAGRIDAAIADLRRLVELDPDNPNALNALGYTLADRTEQHEEALGLIERALALAPGNPAILDSLGWVLHKLGRSEEALQHLQRSFELDRDAEVAAHLGEVLWLLGKHDEARVIWRLGSEIDGSNRALQAALERFEPAS